MPLRGAEVLLEAVPASRSSSVASRPVVTAAHNRQHILTGRLGHFLGHFFLTFFTLFLQILFSIFVVVVTDAHNCQHILTGQNLAANINKQQTTNINKALCFTH